MALKNQIVSRSHVVVLVCLDAFAGIVNINVVLFKFLKNVYIDGSRVDSHLRARNFGQSLLLKIEPWVELY